MKKTLALLLCLLLVPLYAAQADVYQGCYEIFVASYCDSDGDNMGDLNGVTMQLDAIEDLGADAIWLMPIMSSPSYHKYDVVDYYGIDEQYGTMADLDTLIKAADKRNIAVLLDLVINHTSSLHPWFTSAVQSLAVPDCGYDDCTMDMLCQKHNRYCTFYHFSLEPGKNMHALANGWYYEGAFGDHMPDLNLENQEVLNEIFNIMSFYLDKGIQGFRIDALKHFEDDNVSFNNAVIAKMKARFPDTYLVGEVWSDAQTIAAYYQSGIDAIFNYPFATQDGAIVKAIKSGNGAALAQKTAVWQDTIWGKNANASIASFLSNHDNGRSAGYFVRDTALEKLAARLYLLMPGTPFIYYGEEIGMTGSGKDENKRQAYVWSVSDPTGIPNSPKDADQTQSLTQGYKEQREDPLSLLNTYRDVLAAKKTLPDITSSPVRAIDLENEAVYALMHNERVLVVHNLGKESALVQLEDGYVLTYAFAQDNMLPLITLDGLLDLPPFSSAILVK